MPANHKPTLCQCDFLKKYAFAEVAIGIPDDVRLEVIDQLMQDQSLLRVTTFVGVHIFDQLTLRIEYDQRLPWQWYAIDHAVNKHTE